MYRGKTSKISQAISHTFLNLCHNSEQVDAVISGTGRPQENRIFRFLKVHLKNRFLSKSKDFFAEVHCMKYRIRCRNKNLDDMGVHFNIT